MVLSVKSTRNDTAPLISTLEFTIILTLSKDTSADRTLILSLPSFRIPEALITFVPSEFS